MLQGYVGVLLESYMTDIFKKQQAGFPKCAQEAFNFYVTDFHAFGALRLLWIGMSCEQASSC